MLLLLSAYAAAIFHFASYSSSAAVDREASSSSLTKRQDGPHCNDKFGFPNYGDCEAAWAQIPVDDGIASLVFGPPATPGASVITPWFVSKGMSIEVLGSTCPLADCDRYLRYWSPQLAGGQHTGPLGMACHFARRAPDTG